MSNPWFFTIVTAMGFGGWPLIVRAYPVPPIVASLGVSIGTLLFVSAAYGMPFFKFNSNDLNLTDIIFCVTAGFVNGIAFISYTWIVTNPSWAESYIPISLIFMIAFLALGGIVFFNDEISLRKIIGFCFGVISIYILTTK